MKSRQLSPEEIAKKYHTASQKPVKFSELKKHFGCVKTPTVYQMEVSECGAASLSMILRYYGRFSTLEELRVETGVSRNGCNAKNICIAAENMGMTVTASKRDLDRVLLKNHAPCIIHWNYSHFLVFEGVKGKDKYCLNDPQMGRRCVTRQEMEEGYSGTVIQCEPSDNFVRTQNPDSLFQFTKQRLEGQYAPLAAMLLIGIALIAPGALHPVFSQIFTDYILQNTQRSWMKWLLLAMLLTAAFDAYFTYLSSKLSLMLQSKMTLLSTDNMITHMLRLPMEFFEQRYAGDLVSRVSNNIKVASFLSGQLTTLVISLLTSLVYLVIMLFYSPILAMIGVGFSIFSMAVASFTSSKIATMTMKFGIDSGKLLGVLYNGLSSSASLKAVGAEDEYTARVLGYYAEVNNNDQHLGRIQSVLDIIPQTISSLNNVIILIIGGKIVSNGDMTAGMLMAFTGFLGSFSSPFSSVVGFVRNLAQVRNDLMRVEDIMCYKEEENYAVSKNESLEGRKLTGEVTIDNISFAYGKLDDPLIHNFSLHAMPGQSIALVGSSGCGKSTISKLLSGLYHPRKGTISYDGFDAEEVPLDVISASVAVVTQQISLFEGTIFDNISSWNDSISQEEVVRAAKDACIHDDITLKKGGYDYKLNENGANLSGGQRQRIEIAKALAVNPTILILDEATSALDTSTEKMILDNIRKRNITLIVVAQRLSTIRDCNEIIVMDKGRIKERGVHEQLMQAKGLYYRLVGESE